MTGEGVVRGGGGGGSMIEKRSKGGGYLCIELEGLAEGIGCKQKIY